MKKRMSNILKKLNMANFLSAFAIIAATIAANSCCIIIYHQPTVPEDLKRLRKF